MKHFLLLIAIAISVGLDVQVNTVSLEASALTIFKSQSRVDLG